MIKEITHKIRGVYMTKYKDVIFYLIILLTFINTIIIFASNADISIYLILSNVL